MIRAPENVAVIAAIAVCAALSSSCGASEPAPVAVEIAPAIAAPDPASSGAPDPADSERSKRSAAIARSAGSAPQIHDPPPQVRETPTPVGSAETLFQEARQLMAQGSFAEACPKLEESQKLDPGIGTLLNLATCEEKLNQRGRACAHYAEAAQLAQQNGQPDRAQVAQDRFMRLGCSP